MRYRTMSGICVTFLLTATWAQKTDPIKPATPDIVIPPAIELPPPAKIDEALKKSLTADDAVVIALAKQQSLVIAKALVRQARGQKQVAQSSILPTMLLTSSYTDLDIVKTANSGSSSSASGYQTNLAFKQLLFDFSHSQDLFRQARYTEQATVFGFRASVADLVLNVKQAYFAVIQNQGLMATAEANVKSRENQLKLAEAKLESGLGAPADVINAKTNLADAATSLTQARLNLVNSKVSLARTMGVDARTPLELYDSTQNLDPLVDLEKLTKEALENRPDVREALAIQNAAQAGLAAAKTVKAPALSFTANYNARGVNKPFDGENLTYVISLSWSLFDAGETKGRTESAKANMESATASLELAKQNAIADVTTAYLAYQTALQKIEISKVALINAQEGVRLAEGRYKANVATFVEITTAQAALFTARSNDTNAQSALRTAEASLERALGRTKAWKLKI